MQRVGATSQAIRPSTAAWTRKESPQKVRQQSAPVGEHIKSASTGKSTAIVPLRKGGFFDKNTILEQELYRYHPSGWLVVRIGSLLAFLYIMCVIGSIIWPRIIELAVSHDLEIVTIALPMISIMSMTAFFSHNALYGLLYHFGLKSFDKYRVDDKPWHWEMDPGGWKVMLRKTIGQVLFNFIGLTFPLMYINSFVVGTPLRLDAASLPTEKEMLSQILFCLVLEDFAFHHVHQLLHTKHFYWIHKVHHRYHSPIGISAAYAHPIEYVFGNILPSVLGPMLLQQRMHGWSFCIWLIFRASAAIENHSGYEFPWSMYQAIPFKAPTEYHDFHHNRNQGTYSGVLRFWDWVYGTNKHYLEWVSLGRPETRGRKVKQSLTAPLKES